jgi:hypothetical protein
MIPTVVFAKDRTIYFYEDDLRSAVADHDTTGIFRLMTVRDYLTFRTLADYDDVDDFLATIDADDYSLNDSFTINLGRTSCSMMGGFRREDENSLDEDYSGKLFTEPIVGPQGPAEPIDDELDYLEEDMCNSIIEVLGEYDRVIIKLKPGTEPKQDPIINLTTMDKFLDNKIENMELLMFAVYTGKIKVNDLSFDEPMTRETYASLMRNAALKQNNKVLVNLSLANFSLSVPNDVTEADNFTLNPREILNDYLDLLVQHDAPEDELNYIRDSYAFFNEYTTTKVIVSEKVKKESSNFFSNPLTVFNAVAIIVICIVIAASFIVAAKRNKNIK